MVDKKNIFTKDSVREQHRGKISDILTQGGGVDEIVNYIMSRISTVISYERRKYERRHLRKWSKDDGKKESIGCNTQ
jgi:hypothetical protein